MGGVLAAGEGTAIGEVIISLCPGVSKRRSVPLGMWPAGRPCVAPASSGRMGIDMRRSLPSTAPRNQRDDDMQVAAGSGCIIISLVEHMLLRTNTRDGCPGDVKSEPIGPFRSQSAELPPKLRVVPLHLLSHLRERVCGPLHQSVA